MARGPMTGRLVGMPLLVTGIVIVITGAVLWLGLGEARGADERTVVVAAFFVVGPVVMVVGALGLRSSRRAARIEATGILGTARVLSVTQTGVMVNRQPEIAFELEVGLPGRQPYPVRVVDIIPYVLLNRLGDTVLPVRVDPGNPEAVVIDWDEPRPAPGG